ncbi:hypothetical protein G6F37_012908 [Rhizopus arrhizus]|nr:hypothetical protein G6F38_013436 [Rhizopus arrhizus]KAG1140883.1 hypothetical protein G6F37_012908 [Rhizopus arrhizus]
MCTDYTVLNVTTETKKFKSLTHLIPWDEKEKYDFYAVWTQMFQYCRYCYEGFHVVVNCSKRRACYTCWNCGVYCHMATPCIHDKPSKHALEQLETGDIAQSSVDPDLTLPEITKVMETIDKPTKGTEFQPVTEAQISYDETLLHDPPVVSPTPLVASTSSITASTGKTGPKRSRMHAAQKPYKRSVTRFQSVPPKEPI